MPTTDLDGLRDRVEALLKDSTNSSWSSGELDDAIRLALSDISADLPLHTVGSIAASGGVYEYALTALSGLVAVTEVWYPYLSTDDTYKRPHPVKWQMLDDSTLMLDVEVDPEAGYYLRVFYDKIQTLAGLDSAAATTLSDAEKSALVLGAAAYAGMSRAQDRIGEVNYDPDAPDQLAKWANARLRDFQERTKELARREASSEDSRVGGWGDVD